jgi:hypothetical protein
MQRANPEDLFVSAGDTDGRRQLEAIKRWNHEVRATAFLSAGSPTGRRTPASSEGYPTPPDRHHTVLWSTLRAWALRLMIRTRGVVRSLR